MMKEFDVQAKENILKGTLCEEVCEKGHSYCKSFKREMADEEFEQVAMFKGLMKNMDVTVGSVYVRFWKKFQMNYPYF